MSDAVQEFLKKIGPRQLTAEEARQLQLLRIQAGETGNSGLIEALADDVDERKK